MVAQRERRRDGKCAVNHFAAGIHLLLHHAEHVDIVRRGRYYACRRVILFLLLRSLPTFINGFFKPAGQ